MVTQPATPAARVVVLIPALNEALHIDRVLADLRGAGGYAAMVRIVVADGGSRDATADLVRGFAARHPNVELIDNPGRTQAHAMNLLLGPVFAGCAIAIRCDAHADYPPEFIARLVLALEARPEVASVVIPMDAVAGRSCFARGLALVADTRLGAGGSPHRGGTRSAYVEHGHHAAFRLDSFRALGGYDVGFRANEDAEYDRRLIGAGYRIWLDAGVRIGYHPRESFAALARQYFRYGIGRAQNCRKHGTIPALRQLVPVVHVVLLALSILLIPLSAVGWVWPLAYLGLTALAALNLALRHRSWCALAAMPALLAMHTAWGGGYLCGLSGPRPAMRGMAT